MNGMHGYTYSKIGIIPEVASNYLKYKKRPNSYGEETRSGSSSKDELVCFLWFRQAHIVCWASPAPATGICFCCSLTFHWHCTECCLKRRECSQMIIIYPVSLRSGVWMLLKNIKPENQNSEDCSHRIILKALATKWSPWQQVHAQWKCVHPQGPMPSFWMPAKLLQKTLCALLSTPLTVLEESVPADCKEARNYLRVSMGVNSSLGSFCLAIACLWEGLDEKHFVLEINLPFVAKTTLATQETATGNQTAHRQCWKPSEILLWTFGVVHEFCFLSVTG